MTDELNKIAQNLPITNPLEFGKSRDIPPITNIMVRDARMRDITNPKPWFRAAVNLYVYGSINPGGKAGSKKDKVSEIKPGRADLAPKRKLSFNPKIAVLIVLSAILLSSTLFFAYKWASEREKFGDILGDIRFAPHKTTQAEIDSLTGIWLVTTGSPQARPTEPNPRNKIVQNIVEVKYNGKYFTFTRYGPQINQSGYMQFERSGLVSIHSYLKAQMDTIVTPKLSLMILDTGKRNLTVISASWNFDPVDNFIIGIREVYTKLGSDGYVEPKKVTVNQDRNTIYWYRENNTIDTIILRKTSLDSLRDETIKPLVDANSWIKKDPDPEPFPGKTSTDTTKGKYD